MILFMISLFVAPVCIMWDICWITVDFEGFLCNKQTDDDDVMAYISLLIIPCIIYHVTNKETLDLGRFSAFPQFTGIGRGVSPSLKLMCLVCVFNPV